MTEFNLLSSVASITRDASARMKNKEENRSVSLEFGWAYFDGPREQGYGGYSYDGRWIKIAEAAVARYGLKSGDRVLDIGCAKGFFVRDLMAVCPGLQAFGLDISRYALMECHPEAIGRLHQGNALDLPFPDDSFDAVFAINTIHNLDRAGCATALEEMNRVVRRPENCFVQVDAYRSEAERELFEAWMLTAKTYCRPDEWIALFSEAGYRGDYFWTIMDFETTV